MIALINKFLAYFQSPFGLSKLESTIFDALVRKLDSIRAPVLEKQLAAINRVHRSPDGTEVNLFVMRKGKSYFPQDLCFKDRGELKLGAVDICAANGVRLRADVWCVHGHIFSIEYQSSASDFEEMAQGEWKVDCEILWSVS